MKKIVDAFESCVIGLSEAELRVKAYKWVELGYRVEDFQITKRPSILGRWFHPLISGYYKADFTVVRKK